MSLPPDFLENLEELFDESPQGRLLQHAMKIHRHQKMPELAEDDKVEFLNSEVLLKKLAASAHGMFVLGDLLGTRHVSYMAGFPCPGREAKYGTAYLGDPIIQTNFPLYWRLTYVLRRFAFVDPAFWRAYEEKRSRLWDIDAFEGPAQALAKQARNYNICQGVALFLEGEETDIAFMSLVASDTCSAEFLWRHIDALNFFIREHHAHMFQGHREKVAAKIRLDPVDGRVLALLCQGMGDLEIAKAVGMSLGKLEGAAQRLYSAVGVSDRRALINRAEIFGLVQTQPTHPSVQLN